ncbi:MAG: hypothetical protein II928_05120 [Paludibacteraceae bacterium]|nr:hypothetical protein [Paludibacteraceae bacterium]
MTYASFGFIYWKKKGNKRKEPKEKKKKEKGAAGGRVYYMPYNPIANLYHHQQLFFC